MHSTLVVKGKGNDFACTAQESPFVLENRIELSTSLCKQSRKR